MFNRCITRKNEEILDYYFYVYGMPSELPEWIESTIELPEEGSIQVIVKGYNSPEPIIVESEEYIIFNPHKNQVAVMEAPDFYNDYSRVED